jgi:hypothetical protein
MSQALVLAAGTAEHAKELPLRPEMFGVIAIVTFIALLGLTWSFRGSSNKHD